MTSRVGRGQDEERYWSPIHTPVFGPDGNVAYVIQRPEDVTEFVRLKARAGEQDRREEELRGWAERMEAEVFLRAQELAQANADLRRQVEERQRVEAALAREQDFLRAVLDHAADGIVACDGDGMLRFFNRAAREFHGVAEQPLPPERWAEQYDLYLPDDRTRMTKEQVPLFRALAEGSVKDVEMVIAAKGHPPRFLTANGRAITDAEGRKLGAVVVMYDLTARKQAEEQRERAVREEAGRKGAEASAQRLRESEERFRLMADAVPQIVWITDAEGRVQFFNQQWFKYTGIPDVPATADDVSAAVIHPDDRAATMEAFDAARRSGGMFSVEHRIRSAAGKYRWFLVRGEPYREEQTGRIARWYGASVDIHDRKLAEERSLTILESINDAFYAVDADFRFTYVNRKAEQLWGRRREELLGRHYWTEFPQAVGSESHRMHLKVMSERTPVQYETVSPIIARWVDVSIYPEAGGGLSCYFREITDRKRADAELRESAELVRTIAENSTQGMAMMDARGYCTYANKAWLAMTGYTAEEIGSKPLHYLVHHHYPDGRPYPMQECPIDRALPEHFDVRAHEDLFFRKDGSTFPVLVAASPIFKDGRPVSTVIEIRDVSEAKRAEAEREKLLEAERNARAEAERASRMKDEFLATLSHELRTPLNAILGWSQILAGGTPDAEDLSEGLRTIERNARAQTQIIEDLLDMSRIIGGKVRLDVQRLDLAAVVREAVATAKPSADAKGIRLQAVLDPHAGPVAGDPARLQQVMWNLLSNAVKFTPRGGRVQVLLERVNSHLEVSVIDTGEGIPPEFLPHVFDRFRQADATTTRRHGGLGLGLSIVKHLVELHGGSIRVKSAGVGQGATFTVSLPLTVTHHEPGPDVQRRHPRGQSPPPVDVPDACVQIAGVKVLVVDDEPDARALVKRVLEDCEAEVVTAGSAAEALELVRTERPHVIASDIGMPVEDGYALIKRVRALGPEAGGRVPAIALTAYARAEDRVKAIVAGFDMHVAKPVEPAELIAIVASLAARAT